MNLCWSQVYISAGELVAYESILHFQNLWVYWHVNCFKLHNFNSKDKNIWQVAMQELLFKGMKKANQVYHVSNSLYCKSSMCMDAN